MVLHYISFFFFFFSFTFGYDSKFIFFIGVFPSFDPMFVPQDKNVSNYECFSYLPHSPLIDEFDEPSSQISGQDAQALSDVSLEMPIAKSPPVRRQTNNVKHGGS